MGVAKLTGRPGDGTGVIGWRWARRFTAVVAGLTLIGAPCVLAAASAGAAVVTPAAAGTDPTVSLPANGTGTCAQDTVTLVVTCSYGYTAEFNGNYDGPGYGTGYINGEQVFTVPTSATGYTVTAVGASGGFGSGYPAGDVQGLGAVVTAPLAGLVPGSALYVDVGGVGGNIFSNYAGIGGFNGGGYSGEPGQERTAAQNGGGGASDVRTVSSADPNSLSSRLVVAGGGGGAGSSEYICAGGNAGGVAGAAGTCSGNGGTQTAGGVAPYGFPSCEASSYTDGSLGTGGNTYDEGDGTPGGGGGYYGGSACGGGGSSYPPADFAGVAASAGDGSITISYVPTGPVASGGLTVTPAQTAVVAGTPVTYTVTGTNADGATADVSAQSTFTFAAGTIAGSCAGDVCTPTEAGAQTVDVSTPGTNGPVTSTASVEVTAAAPAAIAATSGSGQTVAPGQAFPSPLTATVTDAYGNPVPGASVTFQVTSGGASIAGSPSASTSTNSAGQAAVNLTGGTVAGPVTVSASTPGVAAAATFSESVVASPAAIAATSGGGQTTGTSQPFSAPLVATVIDNETPARGSSGVPVTFAVSSGATFPGGATSVTETTNASGAATTPTLTAGRAAGTVTVTATTPGVAATATFTETVVKPSADLRISLSAPKATGTTGSYTTTVTVTDAGPTGATSIVTGMAASRGVTITSAPGGTIVASGAAAGWTATSITSGQTLTYTVTVTASARAALAGAVASTATPDPNYANNVASVTVP